MYLLKCQMCHVDSNMYEAPDDLQEYNFKVLVVGEVSVGQYVYLLSIASSCCMLYTFILPMF